MTTVTRRDAAIAGALLLCVLLSFGLRVVSVALWFCAGVVAWSFAWTVSGRLRTREPVEDNVRVARHRSFVVTVLCLGTGCVGALEAVVASLVQPWWLQILANAGLTLLAFYAGRSVFGHSHEWVLEDPALDKPLFLLDLCSVS